MNRIRTFKKKPVVIQAVQWTGTPECLVAIQTMADHKLPSFASTGGEFSNGALVISTLEGDMTAGIGDWIIKGVRGELYPCKNDIFEATYEEVVEGEHLAP